MTAPTNSEAVAEASPSRWGRTVGGSGDDQREALGELAASYWYCVYAWWRRAGLDAAHTGTATLACFTRWLGAAPPDASDSGVGRMREWLPARLAELAERGVKLQGPAAIAIDPVWAEQRYADEPPGAPDAIFQRRWAITVIESTASTLRAEYSARGEETLFAELLPFAGFEQSDEERYAAAAARTGRTSGAMRKAVFDFRTRQREVLLAFVADTVLDPSDAESEVTALLCACDAPGPEAASAPLPTAIQALRPDEVLARAMQSVRMSQTGAGGWQPPTVEEAARLFPQYEVLSLLGRGGMGAVYKGRQIELDRLVAIKLLPLEVSVNKDFADRFRREARAMAKLNHPHIIAVHDFGTTTEGHLFFAMEFVEGANLHQMIHGPGLLPAHALELIGGVCDALAYAHGKGVVHRDIKPANVMVSVEGDVKVADFGLARLNDPAAEQLGQTMTGTVMGTPDYMAPEQMHGMNVDHRADIYSLGVMLYEMICQEVPRGIFEPPSARVAGVDSRVDQVVIRAMQQKPERRYQSTREMKADVSAASTPLPAAAAAPFPQAASVASPMPPKPPIPQGSPKPPGLPKSPKLAKPQMPQTPPGPQEAREAQETVAASQVLSPLAPVPPPAKKSRVSLIVGIGAVIVVAAAILWAKTRTGVGPVSPPATAAAATAGGAIAARGRFDGLKVPSLSREDTRATPAATLATATKDAPFVNSLGMQFVPVPILGGPTAGQRMLFNVWDTRVQDYEAFVKETKGEWPKADFPQGPTHPAVNVSWDDARAFCNWLTEREHKSGKLPKNEQYRLPTDHEWSCAVGIGDKEDWSELPSEKKGRIKDVFPWGAQWPPPKGAGNYAGEEAAGKHTLNNEVIAGYNDGFVNTSPVGSFAPNQYGLYDIGGNVWQWCEDWFDKDQKRRVLRGASWDNAGRDLLLSSSRFSSEPGRHFGGFYSYSFRCVVAPVAAAPTPTAAAPTPKPAAAPPAATPSPATATKDKPFINGLGMKFVPVPIIGGPTAGQRVLFSVWDTRVQDYEIFARETKREWPKADFPKAPTHPAVMVSWEDAQLFCQWLTAREQTAGRLPVGFGYRLPSDHEWSCAVELGAREDAAKLPSEKSQMINDAFPWGSQWPPPKGAGNYAGEELRPALAAGRYPHIGGVIAGYNDGFENTSPVGSFTANPFGLYDIGGNVWQWCEDWFDKDQKDRVIRGASGTRHDRNHLLSSNRYHGAPGDRYSDYGFRCVLAPASALPPAAKTGSARSTAAMIEANLGTHAAEAGFRMLFDGRTLAGWGGNNGAAPSAAWRVQDGAVGCIGDRSWLVTREEFGDFELRLEWKVGPNGNGGIFFRMPSGSGGNPLSAPEFQLCARDVKDKFQTGALYNVLPAPQDASLPTGQWNSARLIVQGGRCEHWVNEQLVLSYDLKSEEWKKQWQASRFAKDPLYAQAARGSIGLQGWTGELAYRNIRIRSLPASASSGGAGRTNPAR